MMLGNRLPLIVPLTAILTRQGMIRITVGPLAPIHPAHGTLAGGQAAASSRPALAPEAAGRLMMATATGQRQRPDGSSTEGPTRLAYPSAKQPGKATPVASMAGSLAPSVGSLLQVAGSLRAKSLSVMRS